MFVICILLDSFWREHLFIMDQFRYYYYANILDVQQLVELSIGNFVSTWINILFIFVGILYHNIITQYVL